MQVLGKTFGHVNLLELRKSIAWVSRPFMHKWLEDGSWNGRDMVLFRPRRHYRRPLEGADAGRGGKSRRNHEIPESGAFDRQTGGSHVFREQVKVLIARALLTNPELMILDEPSVYLDLAGREHIENH